MRIRFSRSICALLALMIVTSVGCGTDNVGSETTVAEDTTITTETTAEDLNALSLVQKNWNGKSLRIGYHTQDNTASILWVEEDTGDVVDSAIYRRNMNLEDKYNVKLEFIDSNLQAAAFSENLNKLVMSGDDVYDLCVGNNNYWCKYIGEFPYINYHDLAYLDFEKPWWNKTSVEDQTFNGKMYLYQPMISEQTISNTQVIVANIGLLEDNKLSMPYDLVREGKWTIDEMMKMTKDVYQDTNGNSERDKTDVYGFTCYAQREGWGNAFDLTIIGKESDEYKLAVNEERTASIVEKIYSYYFEQSGSYVTNDYKIDDVVQGPWHCQKFANGTVMMGIMDLKSVEQYLRYSEIDYGILPYPKWEASQETYRSMGGGQGVVIPKTVQDTEFIGYMLEAMCYETYQNIIPAYYELALKEKFVQNEDDKEMIDIVAQTAMAWVPYTYRDFTGLGGIVDTLMQSKTKEFASWYAGLKASAEVLMKGFNEIMSEE